MASLESAKTAPFSWKLNPQAMELFLQYIELNRGNKGMPEAYNSIALLLSKKYERSFSPKNMRQKLYKIVSEFGRNSESTVNDLWEHGVSILELDKIFPSGHSITLLKDTKDGQKSVPQSTVPTKKRKASDKNDDEYVPCQGKRPMPARWSDQESENGIEDDDEDDEESNEDEEEDEDEGEDEEDEEHYQRDDIAITISESLGEESKSELNRTRRTSASGLQKCFEGSIRAPLELKCIDKTAVNPEFATSITDDHIARSTSNNYKPSGVSHPPQAPEEAHIMSTMKQLATDISATVDAILADTGAEASQAFQLDAHNYRDLGTKVIETMFGTNWACNDLNLEVAKAQTRRRLPLRVFLKSFIGASLTICALQPLPQGQFDKASAEYDLFLQMLRLVRDDGLQYFSNGLLADMTEETARCHAMRNHIIQRVVPKIDEKAERMARDLQHQLYLVVPAKAEPAWYCIVPHLDPIPSTATEPSQAPGGLKISPGTSTPPTKLEDRTFMLLKNLFMHALTKRTDWEACGEALYEFKFQKFLSNHDESSACCNEDNLNRARSHQVFVSVIPSVWAQYRENRASEWKPQKCISKGIVFLVDP